MKLIQPDQTDEIVAELRLGSIVAVPTETVYGLAIKYDNAKAIDKLTKFKERTADSGKFFALMLPSADDIPDVAIVNDMTKRLITKYLPGELTLADMEKNPDFHNPYYDNRSVIGVRIPNHDFMLRLLAAAGPLIVTSANLRGEAPAITSDEVVANLSGIDACVVGYSDDHPPSTVAKVTGNTVEILRQGSIKL